MAVNVDKSVYQAPMGLDQDPQNPETEGFNDNLAEDMSEAELTELSGDLIGEYCRYSIKERLVDHLCRWSRIIRS